MINLLLALLLLLQPAPPVPFTARWAAPGVAQIAWEQPEGVALTCLSREAAVRTWPIHCWPALPPERYVLTLGDVGPLDASAHPQAGDTYILDQDGAVTRAPLLSVLLLPLMRR